jgi:hypothetical protein
MASGVIKSDVAVKISKARNLKKNCLNSVNVSERSGRGYRVFVKS